ncbi:MAG TPA: 3-phosphoserine/phosphohydroxythreonine transaminase [Cryomorphaceae bacterium]|nr:3-phosphoserine/phosphohydroxythreonine transaminase [Owenweeksia sp.]MBF99124.1 3-phosphoserine/phosphohydroxythreonine transaminase [Owenweeksia sp.]HAD97608.1 3-phosphoserine/phosphohydroxythreonine transaminase [Cryomorphaceae bacterium]HBF21141.1 3-phosphoserine/phosphohydroxythreonine transaminase [Cryomorphaceae bacterium]HCQ16773.1 3-phosphoserine/phosphohydroxythreonine transaminase [Cryomorphaceae bacterium]|tara:strand:+ start:167 stop:1240 length:1074 start_codon:yes stop_codon:yes gene_type:complete
MKKHNFSAGPCILPPEVLRQASQAVLDFDGLELSLIEISHRSKNFVAVMEKAQELVRELLKVPEGYSILFLQGGASLEFVMVPYNLMKNENGRAAYLDTGTWASNAIKEAQRIGQVDIVGSSKDKNYNYIPKGFSIPGEADYFHCTSNNTIFGTQIKEFPETPGLMVCDMSSDIFSKPLDVSKFDLIYAGAQKNMGPAGATLVIVKDEILGKTGRNIPAYLDYTTHISKESMFNTPPVFSVYVSMLTLQWLKDNGGVEWITEVNKQKAEVMYNEIDRNSLFTGTAEKEDRSSMNACFLPVNGVKTEAFDAMWKEAGISGINGHRSVGGYRASMYNALPLESVKTLVDVMKEFERTNG